MAAKIIAFPLRSTPAPAPDGQDRLLRALRALDEAVTAQRIAVAEWREALGRLQTTMHGLADSVMRYRGTLDRVGSQVTAVNAQARALESWADSALAVAAQEG